ncbi:MAG: GspE/PulE family protein [Eubacteriaceae bacterium]|jgi:type IV pilus assembly protein PilB|nr:GspE/PulE family protein [Eubacteriaceae bacterium]
MRNIRLGEVLKEYGYITEEQIEQGLQWQKDNPDTKKRFGEILVDLGFVSDDNVLEAMARKLNMEIVDLDRITLDMKAVEMIPKHLAERYNMLAYQADGMDLTVAIDDPLNFYGIEDIRQLTEMNLILVLAPKERIRRAIVQAYSEVTARNALKRASESAAPPVEETGVEEIGVDAPVVDALNKLLIHGYNMGASDIHIEPFEEYVDVRVRVDGVMTETARLASSIQLPLIARIKIMSDMDIAERRLPQDGHFKATIEGKDINARVSIIPTVYGEKAVIRFLFADIAVDHQGQFGMNDANYGKFRKILGAPNGMIYITGPTGSGKTTTLYMVLDEMVTLPINISTIEDPVERNLTGINQMQVNNTAGLTFERGLRALLRQDPDVIMIGETRDAETASIAVRAAITGHVVFSTIHTNDALSAIVRLEDMEIPPYMVASSLAGVVAQRLVRKVCPHCSEEYTATEEECAALGVEAGTKLKRGKGCPVCNQSGYRGRTALHEVVVIDRTIRRMITEGASQADMEEYLREAGLFTSLQEEARECVLEGITTVEEYHKIARYAE